MTFPVLLLQGDLDDGQPPLYYDDPSNPATAQFSDARLPSRSLGVVLRDAVAIHVGEPEIVLSDRQTLIRSLAQPPGRLGIIPLYAPTSRWW
jgi:hypothetical protein